MNDKADEHNASDELNKNKLRWKQQSEKIVERKTYSLGGPYIAT
jgi:hypothetical protein